MIIIHGRNIWPEDLEYLAKTQPGVNYTDAAAFSVPSEVDQQETAVLVVQCRERDEIKRARLVKTIAGLVRSEFGIDVIVELVPTRTLPRTSSLLAFCHDEDARMRMSNVIKARMFRHAVPEFPSQTWFPMDSAFGRTCTSAGMLFETVASY